VALQLHHAHRQKHPAQRHQDFSAQAGRGLHVRRRRHRRARQVYAAGLVVPEGFDASGNALDETTLYFPLKFDGTTNPITINTAAAIA
jgi:hypothetical protein